MDLLIATNEFPPFRGGISTYAHEMAVGAAKLGLNPVVLAPRYSGASDEGLPFKVVRYTGGIPSRFSVLRLTSILHRELKARESAAIHIADWPFTLSMGALSRIHRRPYFVTCYGTDVLNLTRTTYGRTLGYRAALTRAQEICAISEYTKSLVCSAVPQANTRTVLLGVSSFWRETCDFSDWRARNEISPTQFVILTVARLDRRKGHDTAIKAMGKLPVDIREKIVYAIIGPSIDGDYCNELRNLAASNGIETRWIHGASNAELRCAYSNADLFILTGVSMGRKVEGFGLVYLEAASCGLPSIATSVGAVPEVVRNNETGLVVEPGDLKEISDAILLLATNNSLRKKMGERARDFASGFTWESTARNTYSHLLADSK